MGQFPGKASPELLSGLQDAEAADELYYQNGDPSAFEAALAAWLRLLAAPTFSAADPHFQAAALSRAARALLRRSYIQRNTQDADRAIDYWRSAVVLVPEGTPELSRYLHNLGNGLETRYRRSWKLRDLDEAIRAYQAAVSRHPRVRQTYPKISTP